MNAGMLISKNQPNNWFETITKECEREYNPIRFINISPNEVVIDLGCNVGGFTQAFKHKFKKILAIDASSYNVREYSKRHKHVVLHNAAFSKDNEIVKLKKYMGDGEDDTNSGNFSITNFTSGGKHGVIGSEYEEVETISLETIIDMVGGRVGLLKIDIEGSEFDVLYKKDLTKINFIIGEFHNFLGKKIQNKLFNWISKTHNEVYSMGDGINSHFIKMWKRK